jgi:Tfp pilus tip-associated adhesin PilY1
MKKYYFFSIILFILSGSFQSMAKSPPPGTGTSDIPANILILLDKSGSMDWDASGNTTNVQYPLDVAVDPNTQNIFVSEMVNARLKVYNSSRTLLKTIDRFSGCYYQNSFARPRGLFVKDNILYVVDELSRSIVYLRLSDILTNPTATGCVNFTSNSFTPDSVTAFGGRMFVSSPREIILYNFPDKFNGAYSSSDSRVIRTINATYLNGVRGININSSGTKLVTASPSNGYQVVVWSLSNGFLTGGIINTPGGLLNTSGAAGTIYGAWDADFDSSDNIYVTDVNNNRVKKFLNTGQYNTMYGGTSYNWTGPFYNPAGIVVDRANNKVWVADFQNNTVRSLDTNLTNPGYLAQTNRVTIARNVIKKIVSNADLTSAANFGFGEWDANYCCAANAIYGSRLRVNIDSAGATKILNNIDKMAMPGGGTDVFSPLLLAQNYFINGGTNSLTGLTDIGGTRYQSPVIRNATCQLNYVIIISDGDWDNQSQSEVIARSMANANPSIKTFVIGFGTGIQTQSNYINLANAGGTGTSSVPPGPGPLFATNEDELLTKLTDAVKQILQQRLSFTSAALTSDTSSAGFIYQSSFSYQKDKQWQGTILKYKMNSDGTLGNQVSDTIFDAGKKLNANGKATSRKIWTVERLTTAGLNNFTTTNTSILRDLFGSPLITTDTASNNLINFVRGFDTYDEDGDGNINEERNKLADIYHSQLVIVDPPSDTTTSTFGRGDDYYRKINNYESFQQSYSNRKKILLAGSNGGMLHAFDPDTSEEIWAFIPPSMINKLPKIISQKAKASNAIYGVDGSPIVKDIYFNNQWRTIVLTGLGRGGASYFALDITNTSSPSHLFTIENLGNGQVAYWNSDGQKFFYSAGSKYDYTKLGETWSTPRIVRLKISNTLNQPVDKWVAVFGGGYNGGSSATGSVVYVMDLENSSSSTKDAGALLKAIDIPDKFGNGYQNSLISDLAVITANETNAATYNGAMVYAADFEGKITKINLTDVGNLYASTQLFDSEAAPSTQTVFNNRLLYTGLDATIDRSNKLWLYFGTGDINRFQDNSLNRLYGIRDINFPNFININSPGTIVNCTSGTVCPNTSHLGWYVNLEKNQKVTAQPTVSNNAVYFPIYEPNSGTNVCLTGNAILRDTKTDCGQGFRSPVTLGTGVLSKVQTFTNQAGVQKVIISLGGSQKDETTTASGFTRKDNIIVGDAIGSSTCDADPDLCVTIEGWREN